jgi:hypothetical protein
MPPEPSLLPGFVFGLVVIGTFIAFLWYGCGLGEYRIKERAEELRLKAEQRHTQESDEARSEEVRPMAALPRIQRLRECDGKPMRTRPDSVCREDTRVAIRKAIGSASFFQRRRKVKDASTEK